MSNVVDSGNFFFNAQMDHHIKANAMVSQKFGSEVGHATAISACEPNFRLVSFTFCAIKLTNLVHQIK